MYPLISAGGRFGGVNQCARSEKKRFTRWWFWEMRLTALLAGG